MGNEGSQLSGLEIDEKPTEISDFWAHYQAKINDRCRHFSLKSDGSVSVFKGEAVLGPLWAVSTPLEKFSNNLLKFRHPCIVHYISSWQQRSTLHLATEYVEPLSQVLKLQSPLQKCIGLNNILRALVFLHEQAGMSHNNVSISAVYVTGDGQWKLGGLQYLCPFNELTQSYLKHARIHRYDKAVDSNEDSYEITTKVDQYAFAVLVEDVFKGCKDDEVPHLQEFRKYCEEGLKYNDPAQRPSLSEVLQHNFFNHEFITIYKFLNFLPLKSDEEKGEFFSNILSSLKCYDEETVAKQLSGLLLSRLTMLDQTARQDVIPFILKPKNERTQHGEFINGFFSLSIFKEHVKPRLLQLFGVRDSQIRLLMLSHFSKFVQVFTHEELSQHILPELLLGIKDTDDTLVAATLICLSELVPILGADTVVGGKRTRIFTDGRPNSKNNNFIPKTKTGLSKSLKDFPCSENVFKKNTNVLPMLNERPAPVGGEADDLLIVESKLSNLIASEEDWSDWEGNNQQLTLVNDSGRLVSQDSIIASGFEESSIGFHEKRSDTMESKHSKINKTLLDKAAQDAKKNMIDISDLDIKNQKFDCSKKSSDEFDFFADMAPVIEKPSVVTITSTDSLDFSKLNFVPDDGSIVDDQGAWSDNWNEN